MITFHGCNLNQLTQRVQASEIGYVLQNPDNQIVTDKVGMSWLAGFESLAKTPEPFGFALPKWQAISVYKTGFERNVAETIRRTETIAESCFDQAMQPSVLILDEPTSQLDPIAASDFLETVRKINRETRNHDLHHGHRLEDVFPEADRAIALEQVQQSLPTIRR
jgi:energy-coupling factor transport system ATP-binding protein